MQLSKSFSAVRKMLSWLRRVIWYQIGRHELLHQDPDFDPGWEPLWSSWGWASTNAFRCNERSPWKSAANKEVVKRLEASKKRAIDYYRDAGLTEGIKVERGSGNVFADLGLPNPDEALAKAKQKWRDRGY